MRPGHRLSLRLRTVFLCGIAVLMFYQGAAEESVSWPAITRTQRPWAYWWWMGSAVDPTNITRELTRYHNAGMGGVHIIPIYGAKGWESKYIPYLSPRWMEMLQYTVQEAERLDLGVDMTTGTGWCFGGPEVTDDEANANVVVKTFDLAAGERLQEKFDPKTTQALMAFPPQGKPIELTGTIQTNGEVSFSPTSGTWRVYAISQRPAAQKVKRAAPGGEGWMLNLFYPRAMTNYLRWFGAPFENYTGPKPRAQYHDSYEYRSDWAPDFFAQFEKRRGYRLQDELPALFSQDPTERAGRVKCDYRETISEMMSDVTLPLWVKWSHDHGFITRNEAHGSPGNLLDLYAVADIPETEMFHLDRNKLISKFSSSAAHIKGRRLSSSETGTWLEEHFTETLADMKFLLDDLFLSGVNHIFYHGTCYSPDEAGWPGWVFYASFEMNPRNSIWHDVPALNAYAARCQAILQSGKPDNDVLVYWPIYDRWSSPTGMVQNFTVHAREWFEDQPVGKAAEYLWDRGYQFDFISDHQLRDAKPMAGAVRVDGGVYSTIIVPKCDLMPLETLNQLVKFADAGATVIFQDQLPSDVPGLADLDDRRAKFKQLIARAEVLRRKSKSHTRHLVVGDLPGALTGESIDREKLFDQPGMMCIRRVVMSGPSVAYNYFLANRGNKPFDGWLPFSRASRSATILDPLTGRTGVAKLRAVQGASSEIYIQIAPGGSLIVRTSGEQHPVGQAWSYGSIQTSAVTALNGSWNVRFLQGGPELPSSFVTDHLESWTKLGDTNAQRFAGTALYTLTFDAPSNAKYFQLDLGKVSQSARVRVNGRDLGTLITPPFRVVASDLNRNGNVLEVEVTNVSANRIRDLDRRGVVWRNFNDINFVNLNYRPFDASNWELMDSGLIGPVTITPASFTAIK